MNSVNATTLPRSSADRIAAIDGLRGVAILFVMLFHAYVAWPDALPYGKAFAAVPAFKYGWLGVQLFFLISCFVIMMTLEKCASFGEFIKRRWLRLFPAMFVCSLLIFATAPLLPERPSGMPGVRDLLPGLTFVEPSLWGRAFGSPQKVLEGAFWSLFVEAKFYLVFGGLYFWRGRRAALACLLGLFVCAALIYDFKQAGFVLPKFVGSLAGVTDLLSARHYAWFAAGAVFYRYYHEREKRLLAGGVLLGVVAALNLQNPDGGASLAALIVLGLFVAVVASERVRRLVANPVLLYMGFISYPLYLLHENMMVALIAKFGRAWPTVDDLLMPVLPMAVVIAAGSVVAYGFEPALRRWLRAMPERWSDMRMKLAERKA